MTDQMDAAVDDRFVDDGYGGVESATTAPSVHYVNESGLPDELIYGDQRFNVEIASAIEKWSQSLSPNAPTGSIDVFSRNKWNGARHPFAIMSQCAWAVENDDILSTLADVTEGLTFKKMRFELNDDDQEDMWNQWARDVDLDTRLREQFRDLYKVSQFYVGLWWEQRTYSVRDNPIASTLDEVEKVRQAKADANNPIPDGGAPAENFTPPTRPAAGPGRGNRKRKKKYPVTVPTAMTIFDPTKIMPVGTLMFGRERFAYIADDMEHQAFSAALRGDIVDATVMQLIEGRYTPTAADRAACAEVGVEVERLYLLKEGSVYRHTLTRAQYERFAAVRFKPILEILDLKKHQRSADRAALIGNTNFIVVITKGTDKLPAKAAEIENLREQSRLIARLPVLVGDHRLKVEIVCPNMDHTLQESRWQVLDSRLVFKALMSFQPIVQGGNSAGGVSEMSRVVSQGLENRRHQLVRSLERFIFSEIMKRNEGVLDESPTLVFAPKRITLDFSADIMNAILKLRDRGDVSRETALDEFDYDQDTEVVRRAKERAFYDDVFQSGTPYGSPQQNPYGASGGTGTGEPHGQPAAPAAGAAPAVGGAPAAGAAPAPKPPVSGSTPEGGRPPGAKDTQTRQSAGQLKA